MHYLALDVGGSATKYAIADDACALSDKGVLPTCYATHEQFINAIGQIRDRFGELDGIAISTCGEVDPRTGHMHTGGTLKYNAGTNMIRSVEARCGGPVSVENDANCALIAEAYDGALTDCDNGMIVVLGTAIGGAILIESGIYRGSRFHSGNASYTRTDVNHPDSVLLADTTGVASLIRAYATTSGRPAPGLTTETIFARVSQGEAAAVAALDAYCTPLAGFVYNAQMLLDLQVVAIGGGISAQPLLVPAVQKAVDHLFDASPDPLPRPTIRPCRHRNDANLIGATRHHLEVWGRKPGRPERGVEGKRQAP
jgi:predicted NBD/HSP70 family sugar kinase